MIRFSSPRCKSVIERPESDAGSKFSCGNCRQRLQVPMPPPNKTVIGSGFFFCVGMFLMALPR